MPIYHSIEDQVASVAKLSDGDLALNLYALANRLDRMGLFTPVEVQFLREAYSRISPVPLSK